MKPTALLLVSCLTLVGISSRLLHAGTYFPAPTQSEYPQAIHDQQPPGLTLKLSLPKDHFFQGEEIPATLTYSNSSKIPYHLDRADWNRSRGVMNDIAFYARSDMGDAAPDPIAWYLSRSMQRDGGGGNTINLGEWSVTFGANQWLRFDHPGHYTIYAWSGRVQTGAYLDSRDVGMDSDHVQLVSNPMSITIDPRTPQQEQAVIQDAHEVLSHPRAPTFMGENFPPEVMEALNRLWYLQTPAARAELFPFLSQGNNDIGGLVVLGIVGAHDPKAAAAELLAAVERGNPILNQLTVDTYAALKTSALPAGPLGLNQISSGSSPFTYALESARKEIISAVEKAFGGKGPAFIGALWAAFEAAPQDPATRAALVQHQLEMSADQRHLFIESWQSEVWVDSQPKDSGVVEELQNFRRGGLDFLPVLLKASTAPDWNPYALAILCKLEPDVARPMVIADIKRDKSLYLTKPNTFFSIPEGLTALPEKPIPELTEIFRQKLKGKKPEPTILLPLIDRYGTPDLLPEVIRFYQAAAGNWECAVEDAVLRFWIRCDPPAGWAAFSHTFHSRKQTRCYTTLIENVLSERWSDQAQAVALEALNDPDPEVVVSAIKALQSQGTSECAGKTILALERIHDMEPPAIPDELPAVIQKSQQANLAKSLLQSKRWTFTPVEKVRLKKIAGGEN